MKLYGYWRSSASWRVRIGLALKNLSVETEYVHLVRDGGEQKSAAFRAKNPMAQIPVLELGDGTLIAQSLAILEYLDETVPQPPILPGDPKSRARVRQLSEMVNSGIQPFQNLSTLSAVQELGGDQQVWARRFIGIGVLALEAAVARTAGTFMVGDAPTMADICLVPQLFNARRFGASLDACPTLLRIEQACNALPAFANAHPDRQLDKPADA